MAQNIVPQPASPVATPQHYVPPSTRDLRAQTVYRLQIGLSGLAAMLLIVGLANIIMDRARQSEAEHGVVEEPTDAAKVAVEPVADPLADAGVAPSPSPSAKELKEDPAP
ncbi:MAG: hypothetical protein AB7F98_12985 [Novosphingobium sp.]